jgi:hypothetical protein
MIWIFRSFALTLLLFGALNAASYFWRSVDGGNLVGTHPERSEELGFPWRVAVHYCTGPEWELEFDGFFKNIGVGVVVWIIVSGIVLANRRRLAALESSLKAAAAKSPRPKTNFQFSLRGLLILMAICSVLAAAASQLLRGRPEVLAAIYAAGPWLLVGLAYLPARIPWQQRVALIIPLTIILIALAIVAGAMLVPSLPFDKTLIGIFVCWTPQTGLAAIGLTLVFLALHWRRSAETTSAAAAPSAAGSAHPPAG